MTARLCILAFAASTCGCLAFGGPLVGEEDESGETTLDAGTGDESGAETDTNDDECGPTQGIVDRVIDGDTVVLVSGERIRYILVDTPEITGGNNECWGTQASDFNASLVVDREVTLEYDVECEDQYERLLAYIYVDGVEVNRTLLEQGHACLLHIPPNGNARALDYQQLEYAAEEAELGMWGGCPNVSCD